MQVILLAGILFDLFFHARALHDAAAQRQFFVIYPLATEALISDSHPDHYNVK